MAVRGGGLVVALVLVALTGARADLENDRNLLHKTSQSIRAFRESHREKATLFEKTQLSEKSVRAARKGVPLQYSTPILGSLLPGKVLAVRSPPEQHDGGVEGGCEVLDGLKFDTILASKGNTMAIQANMIASGQKVLMTIRVGEIPKDDAITGAEEKFLHEQLIYSYLSDSINGDSVNMLKTSNVPVDGKIKDGRCIFYREGQPPGGMMPREGEQFIGSKVPEGYPGHYNYLDNTIVTGSDGIKTHVDFPALRACTGQDPENPVCYIQVLELPRGVFPIGMPSSPSSNTIRRPATMRKAKALLFQIIYGLAYQFKTIGFQHWRLDETNIVTRQWPIGRKMICYLIKQSHGPAADDIEDAVRCVEKEDLTYSMQGKRVAGSVGTQEEGSTTTAPTTTNAELATTEASVTVTTGAPTTSDALTTTATEDGVAAFIQEDDTEAIDFILSDFVGSTGGCGKSCGQACGTCGGLHRVKSTSEASLNDRSSLLLLWAKIRPCGLNLLEDFPNMDEIENLLNLDKDCPEGQKPVIANKVEKAWIQAIWDIPTDILATATEITKDQYQNYKMHYRAVLGHKFFSDEGVQDHFDSFASAAIEIVRCVESDDCVIRGCEPGDERCRKLTNTNLARVNIQ